MEEYDEAEGWDEVDDDPVLEPKVSETSFHRIKDYAVWSAEQIVDRQKKIINEAIELMGLSEDDAITALKHFNWNPEKLQERWFDNEDETRKTCGLEAKKDLVSRNMNKQDLCYICYEQLKKDN